MFTCRKIRKIAGKALLRGPKLLPFKGISTDTRTIKPGELFIPLRGKNFDGRKFIPAAIKKGAAALDTKDGLKILRQLAAYHRGKFNLPIIGITGSCGKTTTKDMLASILSQKFLTLKNEGNFNNEIGVPLTLLKLTKKHKAAVIEMGMQKEGEIEALAKIARPTIAIITNIGEAHLKYFKTKKNIAKTKAEIFKFLRPQDYAVINQEDEYFEYLKKGAGGRGARVVTFGLTKDLGGIKLPIPGEHNIYNALAAIAAAKILGISKAHIKKGLENFSPSGKRMEIIKSSKKVTILNDTYNANPQSMAAALKTLAGMRGRKIAVLGEMLELGIKSKEAHKKIIALARDLKIDKIYTFGKLWPESSSPYKEKKSLKKNLRKFIRPRDIILAKGSRGTKMEEVVEALK